MAVTTRNGDEGMTDTFDGRRVSKTSPDIELIGTMDELNSAIGLAKSLICVSEFEFRESLHYRQKEIMTLMGSIDDAAANAANGTRLLAVLEAEVERLEPEAAGLKSFVIPGETPCDGALHVARTVCRRCERLAVRKADANARYRPLARYLNRLSDVLYFYALRGARSRALE